MSNLYKAAGVDLTIKKKVIGQIKQQLGQQKNVISDLQDFAGMFDISALKYKSPVLVASCDGVGTKLYLTIEHNNFDTIGQDLVAMCANDLITCGAMPLYFLDYISVNKLALPVVEKIIHSILKACQEIDCVLLGGETAQMPGLYKNAADYDLAGFINGIVEKTDIINGANIKADQIIIGISSSGVHANGFSLIRKIFFEDHQFAFDHQFNELDQNLITTLLQPTYLYVSVVKALLKKINIFGMAHITGGGWYENMPRLFNNQTHNLCAEITINKFPILPIFKLIQTLSQLSTAAMFEVFNMGIGYVIVVDAAQALQAQQIINKFYKSFIIGKIITSNDNQKIKIIYE